MLRRLHVSLVEPVPVFVFVSVKQEENYCTDKRYLCSKLKR